MEPQDGAPCEVCGLVPLAPSLTRAARVVAHSPAMQALLKRVARFAVSDAPVAIRGETGSGKEVVARLLHANGSRPDGPFVAVNVAALPAELLESELFGHGRGAFTGAGSGRRGLFEEASGGTLFLDEIGEMSAALQAKLLRALQDGEVRRVGENRAFAVDARVVCATHRDLRDAVRDGRFREDLYYRLRVLELTVPPLRDRHEDILPLARRFVRDERRPLRGFTPPAEAALLAHAWPGNVRELANAVRHGAALAASSEIALEDLPEELAGSIARPVDAPRGDGRGGEPWLTLAALERVHVLRVLDACGGSQSEAARVLGIGRNTLWRKLRAWA
ncbi:MAG: sigma-54-dependent Fis family transcriptional regulator [Polyangiaceae bacterium]|nr:sigma-54-dependent Fis family transcriptional regulator [Polyangiaceae bacterium]